VRRTVLFVAFALVCLAATASAQPLRHGWISFNVGPAGTSKAFTDTVQTPLYQETETITTTYPPGAGIGVSGAGAITVWRQLTVGIGLTAFSHKGDASIDASLPHPFFDNQPRAARGTTSATHDLTSIDVKIGILAPLTPKLRLLVTGGPSFVDARQTIVTGVTYTESYPFDTAAFVRADTQQATHGDAGFNAGVDVFWLLSAHVGAGGMVQVTHATVKLPVGDRSVSMDAGGVFGGGGIRLLF
jgi:hypothetical protein